MVYDGDGNRVQKWQGSVATNSLIDALNPTGYPQVLTENYYFRTSSSEISHQYVYGLERLGEMRNYAQGTQYIFYVYDGHGSVRALTDLSGTVTDTYDYDAFGNLIHSTGTTYNNFLFAGEQFDPDLGLYYNRARYLNTTTGRFWSMDSFEGNDENSLSLHKYLYTEADPVNNTDPCGRCIPSTGNYGNIVQQYIFEDFSEKTGGSFNISIADILHKTVPSGLLMPDLVDPNTLSEIDVGQIYEIKSVYSTAAAVAKVALYVSILNVYGRGSGLKWIPGVTYMPPPIVPIDAATVAIVSQPFPGVITYCVINQVELISLSLASATAALYLDLSTAVLTTAYAY
jgi:RHS repeat-associated protein